MVLSRRRKKTPPREIAKAEEIRTRYSTIVRAFKGMGVKTATLELGSLGKVALW